MEYKRESGLLLKNRHQRESTDYFQFNSAETFRAIMHRERCRVDRNSHAYSLAVFQCGTSVISGPSSESLIEVLSGRMRATDEAGWFDQTHIAVLLDHTDGDGARTFAEDVCNLTSIHDTRPEYRIYTYSSRTRKDDDTEQGPKSRRRTDFSRSSDRLTKNLTETNGQSNHSVACSTIKERISPESVDSAETEDLGPYLACPIPLYKRILDLIGASMGLVLLAPLFTVIAVFIKIVSPGPIFFRQERIGYKGKKFRMWKFRTMRVDGDQTKHQEYLKELIQSGEEGTSDNGKAMQKMDDDPRIIPFGKVLRKSCVDELPQLINVLTGEMSLIGPRPPIPYEVDEYHRWHYGRFDTLPGMTGLWQVNGKNKTTFKEMIRYDIQYARKMSPRLDAKILLGTIPAIITQIRESK